MNRAWFFYAAVFVQALLATPSLAETQNGKAFDIAKRGACLGCHATDKKIVGPSFQSVAEKYKDNPRAAVFLASKVRIGGAGSWGVIPMPANTSLSDSDLTLVIAWVLRGAPSP